MKRLAFLALLCVLVSGCGSSAQPRPPQPKLPALAAEQLAARSDKVAAALDGGDACRALDEARHLQQEALDAINTGRIPAAYQEQLVSSISDLVNRITCVPPEPRHEKKEHGHGKDKHKKHGEGD